MKLVFALKIFNIKVAMVIPKLHNNQKLCKWSKSYANMSHNLLTFLTFIPQKMKVYKLHFHSLQSFWVEENIFRYFSLKGLSGFCEKELNVSPKDRFHCYPIWMGISSFLFDRHMFFLSCLQHCCSNQQILTLSSW